MNLAWTKIITSTVMPSSDQNDRVHHVERLKECFGCSQRLVERTPPSKYFFCAELYSQGKTIILSKKSLHDFSRKRHSSV